MDEPWAYVAESGGCCVAVIAADVSATMLKRFYQNHAGCEIKAMADRAQWDEYLAHHPFGEKSK